MDAPSDGGVTRRLRRLGAAFVEAVQLRYELVSMELRDERSRLVGLVLWSVVTALAGFMAFLWLNIYLLLRFWEQRTLLAGALILVYGVVALILALALRSKLRNQPTPFAATVDELRKDVLTLSGKG